MHGFICNEVVSAELFDNALYLTNVVFYVFGNESEYLVGNIEVYYHGFSLENILTDTESEERMLEKIALRQAVDALPQREQTVIRLRYFHALTQQRVAKVMDISQVQVSRIEKKAITLLRELLA